MNFLEIDRNTAIRIDKIYSICVTKDINLYTPDKWVIKYVMEGGIVGYSRKFKTRKEAEEVYTGILPVINKLVGRQNNQKIEIIKPSEDEYKKSMDRVMAEYNKMKEEDLTEWKEFHKDE